MQEVLSLSEYLLSDNCVLGTILGAGIVTVNSTSNRPVLMGLMISGSIALHREVALGEGTGRRSLEP